MNNFLNEIKNKARANPRTTMAVVGIISTAILAPLLMGGEDKDQKVTYDTFQEPIVNGKLLSKKEAEKKAKEEEKEQSRAGQVVSIDQFIDPYFGDTAPSAPSTIDIDANSDPLKVNNRSYDNDTFKIAGKEILTSAQRSDVIVRADAIEQNDIYRNHLNEQNQPYKEVLAELNRIIDMQEKNSKDIDDLRDTLTNVLIKKRNSEDPIGVDNISNRESSARVNSFSGKADNKNEYQKDLKKTNFSFKGLHLIKSNKYELKDSAQISNKINGKHFVNVITDESKIVKNGDIIAIRTLEAMTIENKKIDAGIRVYARVDFGNKRLNVVINSLVNGKEIIPFKGKLYDRDGFPGIYCAEVKDARVLKNDLAANINSLTSEGLVITESKDIKGQLALKGVDAAFGMGKIFAAMKLSEQSVEVAAGYPLIMQIEG